VVCIWHWINSRRTKFLDWRRDDGIPMKNRKGMRKRV
jgi:hypothetical protein